MSSRVSLESVGGHRNENLDVEPQQPQITPEQSPSPITLESSITLKSDLAALGFNNSEIEELFCNGDLYGNELSRCLGQLVELQRSIQLQEQHAQTVLRADSALRMAEQQLCGEMACCECTKQ